MSERRLYVLEVLTPVHVGSGMLLPSSEVAYDERENRSHVLDLDAALDAIGPEGFQSAKVPGPNELLALLRRRGVALDAVCWESLKGRFTARDLRLCVRDGRGCPIIPGSSLKGALRTAVLAGLAWDAERATRTERGEAAVGRALASGAAGPFETALLRPDLPERGQQRLDPHHDPFRLLAVTDATFSCRATRGTRHRVRHPAPSRPRGGADAGGPHHGGARGAQVARARGPAEGHLGPRLQAVRGSGGSAQGGRGNPRPNAGGEPAQEVEGQGMGRRVARRALVIPGTPAAKAGTRDSRAAQRGVYR
ncbi:MAG: hypothetical protein HY744_26170 [Deltaproteobacteria bacterium]|nr:hypothetical protein [Deltaproteobacteria bacterium]